jgi:5-formyltetrahydrofolate cyclo-ligase
MMKKAELRKRYLSRQRSLSLDGRCDKSRDICRRLFEGVDLNGVRYLHCFIPIAKFNEVNTYLIFERLWAAYPAITTVVPRISPADGQMHNVRFTSETVLAENVWNIPEPIHNDLVDTADIDLVLVPLLCFDRSGHRVGYGKGFYDRFLINCRRDCQKTGLSYFPPVGEIDDTDVHDVTLDRCITPGEIFTFENN